VTRLEPVVLEGEHVRLEPLSRAHVGPLARVGLDPELWRWTTSLVRDEEEMRRYVEAALALQQGGSALPFAIVHRPSGEVAGSTRYGNVALPDRRLEIGWSWVARPWQRTPVNTEAKLLLMRHAFETLGMNRVEFKTDLLNERSRAALVRIGATQEGIFRRHMITETGRVRDSVYFSVIAEEWPRVRAHLEAKLSAPSPRNPEPAP